FKNALRLLTNSLFPYTTLFRSCECAVDSENLRKVKKEPTDQHHVEVPRQIEQESTPPEPQPELNSSESQPEPDPPSCQIPQPKRSEEHTSELQSRIELVCRRLI